MMLRSVVCVTALFASAQGHGYVVTPSSRSWSCNQKRNTNCGAVQYEPQSVEGEDRYPETGPADGTVAAAGKDTWAPLNEQSTTRWAKTSVSSGAMDFTWAFRANHVTRDWRYFITKEGWNGVDPLGRETLEGTPFCTVDGEMQQPPLSGVTHSCTVPTRSGYHVVLAVWDVGDTSASFYNAIDLDFNGASNNFGSGNGGSSSSNSGGSTTTTTSSGSTSSSSGGGSTSSSSSNTGGSTTTTSSGSSSSSSGGSTTTTSSSNSGSSTTTATVPTNLPPPAGTCSGPKIAEWGSCLSSPSCCEAPSRCYQQSQWYAQCRVKCDVASQCKLIG